MNISTDSTLFLTIDGPYEVTAVYSEIENYKISGFSTWIIFGILGISSSKNTKKQF